MNLVFRRLSFSGEISLYKKYLSYYEQCYKCRPSMLEEPSLHISKPEGEPYSFCRRVTDDTTDENEVDMDETSMDLTGTPYTSEESSSRPPNQKEKDKHHLKFYIPSTDSKNSKIIPSVKTRQQAELFIQDQICRLLQQDPSAVPPSQLQKILSTILKNCPDLGKGHFLSYLNCLRVREHTGAIHSLVRAYDTRLMHKDVNRGDDITRTFRYAALNMASLHAQFGHKELGLTSLEEAIRLAQESNDHVCLQYSLSWLYLLSDSQKLTLMKRSHIRSAELNLPYLSWLSLLNYVMEFSKSKTSPSSVLKSLLGPLSQPNQGRSSLEGGLAGQTGLWSVQAGLWAIWGNIPLTAICSQLVLHMSPQITSSLFAPSTASPTCAALCNMAIILANLGEFSLSGEVLHHAQEQFSTLWEHSRLWMFTQCFITFYESLRQGLWSQAKAFATNMATIHPIYSKVLEAELCVTQGEFSEALNISSELRKITLETEEESFTIKEPYLEPEILVKVLLIEAEALSGGSNLGGALSVLVKAISVAKEFNMAYLTALAQLQMACVQMHLGLLNEAKKTLEKGMNVILSGGGIYDQARATLLQAKLQVCCSGKNTPEKILSAAESLEEAQNYFVRIKAFQREKETVYLKARFYHTCGRIEERNKSALEFRQLEQRHPSQPIVNNTCVF